MLFMFLEPVTVGICTHHWHFVLTISQYCWRIILERGFRAGSWARTSTSKCANNDKALSKDCLARFLQRDPKSLRRYGLAKCRLSASTQTELFLPGNLKMEQNWEQEEEGKGNCWLPMNQYHLYYLTEQKAQQWDRLQRSGESNKIINK